MCSESERNDMDRESFYYEQVYNAAYSVWRDASEKPTYTEANAIEDQLEVAPPLEYVLTESTNLSAAYDKQGFVTGLTWDDTRRQVCRAAFAADIREILEENRAPWEDDRNPNRLTSEEDIVDALRGYGVPDEQLEGRETQDIIDELIETLAGDGLIDAYRSEDYYRAQNACQSFLSETL
tara:strand:+ start:1492 stop:2031 length:540 start_codon:yes stop_codon:yes gene_type:complete